MGPKVGCFSVLFLFCCSGGHFLGSFLTTSDFFDGASWLSSVVGNSGSMLEVSSWSKMTWSGRMVAMKMAACCWFVNLASGSSWLFPTRVVVNNGGSWVDSVQGIPSYTLVVMGVPEMDLR